MDDCGGSQHEGLIGTVRKERSQTLQRPRTENLTVPGCHHHSPQTSLSDNVDSVSSDEYNDDANAGERIYNLNLSISRDSSANRFKGDYSSIKNKEDGGSSATYDNARGGDDTNPRHGASVRQLGNAGDDVANDSKLKKLKLEAGGVTRIIQTKNSSDGSSGSLLSFKSAQPSDASQPLQNLTQDNSSEDGPLADKKSVSKGILCEDFPGGTFGASKSDMEKMPMKNVLVLDGLDEDEDEDEDEIHYMEKLNLGREITKTRSLSRGLKVDKYEMLEDVGRSGKEIKRISNPASEYTDYGEEELVSDYEEEELLSDGEAKQTKKKEKQMGESYETPVETKSEIRLTTRQRALLSGKEVKTVSNRGSEYPDYEEEELLSDGEAKRTKKKEKQMKECDETPVETKSKISLTTRQRALLSRRDSSATSVNQIGYSYGCPPAPPQKQKEKLSAVEQELKKTKAAQRRRIQHEKAARESEAEAIRKILGQDSNRKKQEEKIKKQQEELAREEAAKELAPNTIRTVMGPAGTTVTFSHDMGLPSIFDSKPCSYPPPREKCAGPSCVNPFKYRDSKSNLPLCSLKCYKASHEKMQD
ncbi:uncharacterized protein LOC129900376 [Solanum dulcamara]|uniref:uncharacterized protein LOC129900376 n=1 Tax=Solanum dulcamara TaxID=45834 RepID=UPI002485E01B|nr:uncharacterized protein LOC129900376 [Solanum dulcamara]